MALNRKMSPELKKLLDEQAEVQRRIELAERAQKAKEGIARKAASKNGAAYAALVLDLCDELGIEQEHPRVRVDKNDREVEISTDPNDSLRMQRLRDILERIIEAADPAVLEELKRADDTGRDQRRIDRETQRKKATRAAVTDESALEEDDADADAHERAEAIEETEAASTAGYSVDADD